MTNDKPSREQSGLYNLFSRYVKDDGTIIDSEFAIDIQSLREYDDVLQPSGSSVDTTSPFVEFMKKYKFPQSMGMFLYDFVTNDKVDLGKLQYGVYLVDKATEQASGVFNPDVNYLGYITDSLTTKYVQLTLAIPANATITQITKTITEQKQFILDRQAEINNGRKARNRSQPMAERDGLIMTLHQQGLKPREIVRKLPEELQGLLTSPDVSKIISRYKSKRP